MLLLALTAGSHAAGPEPLLTITGGKPHLRADMAALLSEDALSGEIVFAAAAAITPLPFPTPAAMTPVSFATPAALPFAIAGAEPSGRALDCLTAAIYHEARSEGEAGQRAVAQVVLNRTRHPAFPSSVCGVVYQGASRRTGCQFTFTCDGSLRRRRVEWAWAEARQIAQDALAGYVFAPIGLATHYHTRAVNPYWAPTLHRIGALGAHIFYRWRGASGQPGAFTSFASADADLPGPMAVAAVARYVPSDPVEREAAPTMVRIVRGGAPNVRIHVGIPTAEGGAGFALLEGTPPPAPAPIS